MSWVTLDHGNSSLHWCLWTESEPGHLIVQQRGVHSSDPREAGWAELGAFLPEGFAGETFYCGVAGSLRADEARRAWEGVAPLSPWREPLTTLSNDCEPQASVGKDRLMAAQGAHAALGSDVVIVDVGTALTVDALKHERGTPRFMGGAIAPGPAALAAALGDAGAQLFEVAPQAEAAALGRTTAAALSAGVSVGLAGAAARLVKEVSMEAGLEEAPVVITGGARAFLSRARLFGSRELRVFPDLVHAGLLAAAGIECELEEETWTSASVS